MDMVDELKQFMLINTDFLCINDKNSSVCDGTIFKGNKDFFGKKVIFSPENCKKEEKYTDIFFVPKTVDTLFWCFYIIYNGYDKYEIFGNINTIKEKNEKIKYIELLRKNNDTLKMFKIRNLSFVENELVNEDKISVKTFMSLCYVCGINVLIVRDDTIYDIKSNGVSKYNIVKKINYGFGLLPNVDNEMIDKYSETHYRLDNYEMKLKNISFYKLQELLDISKKLGINMVEKKNKKDLYEMINIQLKR